MVLRITSFVISVNYKIDVQVFFLFYDKSQSIFLGLYQGIKILCHILHKYLKMEIKMITRNEFVIRVTTISTIYLTLKLFPERKQILR